MRPSEVVRRGAEYLSHHGVHGPEANAEALMLAVLGVDRAGLLVRDRGLDTAEAKLYGRALCRRCTGTPLQHLTGEQGFRRLVVKVRPGVFVPRPETEILVDEALARLAGQVAPVVADVCTGTGAIALAIAQEHPGAQVIAADLSPEAVALARENASALGLPVQVHETDLLDAVKGPLDLVTCNPPYVPDDAREELPPEVLADPALAVFGGPEIYERLFAQAYDRLRPGGSVVVEIEETTAPVIVALAQYAGFIDPLVRHDLTGRDRVVAARRP
ncbi:MAG: peptide chain release factor N(5)-glutamine methyltransferase [Actinomycetota bacterium]